MADLITMHRSGEKTYEILLKGTKETLAFIFDDSKDETLSEDRRGFFFQPNMTGPWCGYAQEIFATLSLAKKWANQKVNESSKLK